MWLNTVDGEEKKMNEENQLQMRVCEKPNLWNWDINDIIEVMMTMIHKTIFACFFYTGSLSYQPAITQLLWLVLVHTYVTRSTTPPPCVASLRCIGLGWEALCCQLHPLSYRPDESKSWSSHEFFKKFWKSSAAKVFIFRSLWSSLVVVKFFLSSLPVCLYYFSFYLFFIFSSLKCWGAYGGNQRPSCQVNLAKVFVHNISWFMCGEYFGV